jgi:AbrB family looped-hinge helix DNA binding protein
MAPARTRVTSQGQVSVPAGIRRRLGVGPGSILEWSDEGDRVVVRRAGQYTSADVHRQLFAKPPARRSVKQLKDGIRRHIKARHARG